MAMTDKLKDLYNELRETVEECSETDWNSYGAEAVSLYAIDCMKQLLGEFLEELLPDSVGADPCGGVSAEYFRKGETKILFWIDGDTLEIRGLGAKNENGLRDYFYAQWGERSELVEFIKRELLKCFT